MSDVPDTLTTTAERMPSSSHTLREIEPPRGTACFEGERYDVIRAYEYNGDKTLVSLGRDGRGLLLVDLDRIEWKNN